MFGSDGKHLYASVGSITDPSREKEGDTENGIAVYKFHGGKVEAERFIPIAPQAVGAEKKVSLELRKTVAGTAIPYPAGMALVGGGGGEKIKDQLLVANNLSDNAVLLDVASGKVLQSFDLSTNRLVPASFPYAVVAARDGRRAWCSLWNGSQVAELDLTDGKVVRWIKLKEPEDPTAPGSHPTAMLLSRDEKLLYVALSNADAVAVVSTESNKLVALLSTKIKGQEFAGTYPGALAASADGKRLFVADASSNAVAAFDTSTEPKLVGDEAAALLPLGFIPTDWYPSALAVHGDDLLIATAKGEGTGPNKGMGKTAHELKHQAHPYIPTLLRGSIARLNIPSTLGRLDELTRTVENDNLLHNDPERFSSPAAKIRSSTSFM